MAELGVRCGSEGDAEDEGLPFGAEEDGEDGFSFGWCEVVERNRWKRGREERRWTGIFRWPGLKFLKKACFGAMDEGNV